MNKKRMFMVVILGLLAVVALTILKKSASLMITSPANGTVVNPGDKVTITVERHDSGIKAVALHAFEWTGIMQGSDPLMFSITIPATAQPGPVQVVAADMTLRPKPGIGATSAPLILNVQSMPVTALRTTVPMIQFSFAGDKTWLTVIGMTTVGSPVNLENSNQVSFMSQDDKIATVDATGHVIALSPGQTIITATYINSNGSSIAVNAPVTVPKLIRGNFTGGGTIDREDVAVIQGALHTPANDPNDARDLNHDGKIDEKDLEIEKSLCTYPDCATTPVKRQ